MSVHDRVAPVTTGIRGRDRAGVTALAATAALSLLVGGAAPATASGGAAPATANPMNPTRIELPIGFEGEGIDIGEIGGEQVAFLGSLDDGTIQRVNVRTGESRQLSGPVGSSSVGIELDRGRLFVAGGPAGDARVLDASTGELLASYTLAEGVTRINDVVVTEDAAWFTDSEIPVLYRLPLGAGGELPDADEVEVLPLTGDLVFDDDPTNFEANGIEVTPDRSALLVGQSRTGQLYRVDPDTGESRAVDQGGELFFQNDGLTLDGETLYVVQSLLSILSVVELSPSGDRALVTHRITDPAFDVPATVARSGERLYLPNARFGVESPETADFAVVSVPVPR